MVLSCELVNVQVIKPPSFTVTTACREASDVVAEAKPLFVQLIPRSVQSVVSPSVTVISLPAPNDEIPELTMDAPPAPATLSTSEKFVDPKMFELAVNGNAVRCAP